MKILQVITSLRTGGAEALVANLVPLMREQGHQVDVLVFEGTRTAFMDRLEQNGVKVMSLSMNTNVYQLSNIKRLVPIFRQYDIVHTHNTACQMFVAIAKRWSGAKCKLVTTEHNTDNRRRHIPLFRPLDMWMYRQYDAIIAISDEATQLLKEYTRGKYPIRMIPNGVRVDDYLNAQPHEDLRQEGDIIVEMVAAFRPQKDQDTLIRSLTHLPEPYKVWLVGEGVRRQACEQLASQLGVADRVNFWGVRTDVPQMLKTADVVVMSTHYEGMSLSNIEGMSCGRPFVASEVKGIREITLGAGVMFQEGNDSELATVIQRLAQDKDYRDAVVSRCVARAKEYDVSKTAAGYLRVYEALA